MKFNVAVYYADPKTMPLPFFSRNGESIDGVKFEAICNFNIEAAEYESLAEDVFRRMNVVDGTEFAAQIGVRSMSCGDALRVYPDGGTPYTLVCRNVGFERVEQDVSMQTCRW